MFGSPRRRRRSLFATAAGVSISLCTTAFAQENAAEKLPAVETKTFAPEPIHVTIEGLPAPFASQSASKNPKVVEPPEKPILEAPEGFKINAFARVPMARWLAIGPRGEILCVASREETIWVLEDADGDGVAEEKRSLLDKTGGAHLPFGMAFSDSHFFLGNTDAVLRYDFRYEAVDGKERLVLGEHTKIADLPGEGYNQHWTRNVVLSPDEKHLYASVGSKTNADVEEPPRASVLRMNLDGSDQIVFGSGLRNPVGLDFQPKTGELYATVNERDALGDELVPDYLTRVQEGGFYGWPYAYLKPTLLDPRLLHAGKSVRPDLAEKTITPDVLFQAHSAALGLAFYDSDRFPKPYHGGAFVAMRGSWNRDSGTGYKIVFVPFDEQGKPTGDYQDFVRGFLTEPAGPTTWGRPVGVAVTPAGDLLFTDEGNGFVYRVSYGD